MREVCCLSFSTIPTPALPLKGRGKSAARGVEDAPVLVPA
jgi:hypothetical protein